MTVVLYAPLDNGFCGGVVGRDIIIMWHMSPWQPTPSSFPVDDVISCWLPAPQLLLRKDIENHLYNY